MRGCRICPMRIFVFVVRTALTASLIYAVYSAWLGEWARATFFLVLYHIGFTIAGWIQKGIDLAEAPRFE